MAKLNIMTLSLKENFLRYLSLSKKKMSNKIEEEEVKKELSSWVIKQEIVPSKVEPLSTFIEATSKK